MFCCLLSALFCLISIKNARKLMDFYMFALCSSNKIPSFFFKHLNYTFQGIGQIKSSFIKDRWMGYIFPPSDRLRHCREAAVTPPQSVTATALPSHSKRAPLLFLFYQTYRQHNSSIYGLFFALLWTPGYSLFFFKAICMRLCRGMLARQKETASMWVQVQGCDTDGTGYTLRNTEYI